MLQLAKKGKVSSCIVLYVDIEGNATSAFSNTAIHNPDRLIGLMERLKFQLSMTHYELTIGDGEINEDPPDGQAS